MKEDRVLGLAIILPTAEGEPERKVAVRVMMNFTDTEQEKLDVICKDLIPDLLQRLYNVLKPEKDSSTATPQDYQNYTLKEAHPEPPKGD